MIRQLPPGIWYALGAAVLWSTGGLGIKVAVFDGPTTAAYRCLFAALIFLPAVRWRSLPWSWLLLAFVLIYAAMMGTFVVATKLTTASNAIALQYTSIFWVFLLTEFPRKRRIPRSLIPSLLLVLLGIFAFFQEPNTGTNLLGNLFALVSGLMFGAVMILIKRLAAPHSLSLICVANLGSFLPLWAVSGFALPVAAHPVDWALMAYLGVVQLSCAYILFNIAMRTISPLTGNFVTLIEPLLNPLWVYTMLGEFPTVPGAIGWCCLMASLMLYFRTRFRYMGRLPPAD